MTSPGAKSLSAAIMQKGALGGAALQSLLFAADVSCLFEMQGITAKLVVRNREELKKIIVNQLIHPSKHSTGREVFPVGFSGIM